MLPGLDFSEVIIVIVVALLVLGPKDLPLMMRKLGRFMAKMRGMAAEFRSGFDELARQAELDELRKEVDALRRTTRDGLSSVTDDFTRPVQQARDSVMAPLPAPTPTAPAPVLPDLRTDPADAALPAPEYSDPEPPAAAPTSIGGVR
jgi:sec-independent protein translocase protein TatB